MFIAPVSTEIVYQIPEEDYRQILTEHFNIFYLILSEGELVKNAAFEAVDGIRRCLAGSDGLAFGICSKLGLQPKWRFQAFICEKEHSHE